MSRHSRLSFRSALVSLVYHFTWLSSTCFATDPIQVTIPTNPTARNVVASNFLGVSYELSFLNEYFGDNVSKIPPTMINYLSALRLRTGNSPIRLRIGGNSMDSSHYVSTQTSSMLQLNDTPLNADDQPVQYGPVLWDVASQVASRVGGAAYLVGLSLLDPNDSTVQLAAGAAQLTLGDSMDSFLLGNEPDLYTDHQYRPNLQNLTTAIYIDEFRTASSHLSSTPAGNILDKRNLGGPTICCNWDLFALISDGYLAAFDDILKYITLQHYPQNNCFGSHAYEIPYYTQHSNVVSLSQWQQSGIDMISANTSNRVQVIMSEFNSASCGGIPGLSDTFAVGSLWTIDYALQLASVGYSAAYIHTRERGISYNLFSPPEDGNDGPGNWTTNPPYYALLATAEALRSTNGSVVQDLDVKNSRTQNTTVAGYAVYDALDSSIQQVVLFNYDNVTATSSTSVPFVLPPLASGPTSKKSASITVRYLSAVNLMEATRIALGGQTLADVGDGRLVTADTTLPWVTPDAQMDCANGCTVDVPGPGMAIVFINGAISNSQPQSGNSTAGTSQKPKTSLPFSVMMTISTLLLQSLG